ncbi:MAG: HmuY family protein [Bacteroidetes bacterium]|jgi:hypothetical protein|nr:HmuY family protein [Bacteroidota bacterium]
MKNPMLLLTIAITLVFVVGCDTKDDNPVTATETAVRFTTTNNVKTVPTYFSFETGAVTDSAGAWDIRMSYSYMVVDTSMPAIKYPYIALNAARGVTAKIVDGSEFSLVNAATVAGLSTDAAGSSVIGMNCLNYDGTTHRLNPYANRTFVVQYGTSKRVKFKMISYYNETGTSGFMTIDYVKY